MHARAEDIPVTMEGDGFSTRQDRWGDFTVAFETCHGPLDPAPVFAHLPTGRCECPHWGYVVAGSITFRYEDHDETVRAGEAYYAAPGHVPLLTEATQLVEFSPTVELERTVQGIEAAIAAGAGAAS